MIKTQMLIKYRKGLRPFLSKSIFIIFGISLIFICPANVYSQNKGTDTTNKAQIDLLNDLISKEDSLEKLLSLANKCVELLERGIKQPCVQIAPLMNYKIKQLKEKEIKSQSNMGNFDGETWRKMNNVQKDSFIAGFVLGSGILIKNHIPSNKYVNDNFDEKTAEWLLASVERGPVTPEGKAIWRELFRQEYGKEYGDKTRFNQEEVLLILEKIEKDYNKDLLNSFSKYSLYISGKSYNYLEGLNSFYKDIRNNPIKIADAIYIVKKQIHGASDEEIGAILLYLRSPERDLKKLIYIKDEKPQIATFP